MATYDQLMQAARRADADGNEADARRLLQMAQNARSPQPQQDTQAPGGEFFDVAAQAGAGSQQGIAQMLGFPVDALNSAIGGVGQMTGLWEPAARPVLGSEMIGDWLSPFREGIPEPQTRGERIARRVGEEVGASAVGAPLALASVPGRAGAILATEGASALGSGLGAATANEIAPGNPYAEVIGALAGGIPAGMAASRLTGLGPTDSVVRGGIDEQRAIASDAYGRVGADRRGIGDANADALEFGLMDAAIRADVDPDLSPISYGVERALNRRISPDMTIEDVEKLRRIAGRAVPVTASGEDIAASMAMKNEITDYLDRLGGETVEDLVTGRNAHRRASAAQSIADASAKAARRAASTGSGGNEINAMRQNLRRFLDNPRLGRSFTGDELRMMENIVTGSTGQNAARSLSRFAPTSGGLSAMLGIGGAMASPAVALPIMAATEGAKYMGERSTRRAIDALMQSIAPERILSSGDAGVDPVIRALLGARAVSGGE